MNIVEFLDARLAEDEAVARMAGEGIYSTWAYQPENTDTNREVVAPNAERLEDMGNYVEVDYHFITSDSEGLSPSVQPGQAHHIARHDPARVLREVAAKRAIMTQFVNQSCMSCSSSTGGDDIGDCVARLLAAAYSDHPDFDLEWTE